MKPNVLLLVADSVRARNVGLYGHVHETTPNVSDLATRATVYHHGRSPGIWSLPSHTSIFTGLQVPEHGVTSTADKLKPGVTVWETLRSEHEYTTGLVTGNGYVSIDNHGLNDGFDHVGAPPKYLLYPFDGVFSDEFRRINGRTPSIPEYSRYALWNQSPIHSIANGFVSKFQSAVGRLSRDLQPSYPNRSRFLADQFLELVETQRGPWAACMNFGPHKRRTNLSNDTTSGARSPCRS